MHIPTWRFRVHSEDYFGFERKLFYEKMRVFKQKER